MTRDSKFNYHSLGLAVLDSHEDLMTAISKPSEVFRSNGRIPSLDGLRALSIMFVLICHASLTFPTVNRTVHWLVSIVGNGALGVTVFFVLSGFLITTILLKEIRRT